MAVICGWRRPARPISAARPRSRRPQLSAVHRTRLCLALALVGQLVLVGPAGAQLSDVTQTPGAGPSAIQKSLQEQIGAGRGDWFIPNSSRFLIARDPFRSIARGRSIFQRKFTAQQGLGPRTGDGSGDVVADASVVAGFADSCAACHGRPRGSAGVGGNVFTQPESRDAPHLFGLGVQEMLADEITEDLRAIRDRALERAAKKGKPVRVALLSKGIDYGWLTAHPDGTVNTSQLEGIDPDLRVKPFFAEGSAISIRQFAAVAFKNEMGLETPDPDLLRASRGERIVTPAGMVLDGALDKIDPPPAVDRRADGDRDGVVNEIDPAVIDHLEFYLLNYFRPGSYQPDAQVAKAGRRLLHRTGCTACHVADLEIERDRRVADVETVYDPAMGGLNGLFSTATAQVSVVSDDPSLPPLMLPAEGPFVVRDIFTDFKRHDLGPNFWERKFDGTLQREFMTEPLWGVATTAPYGHDGRSINLREVILRHGGEAEEARDAFAALSWRRQQPIIDFLETLVLFGPPDTASNLDPADPSHPDFPQSGHGSIALKELFRDPIDLE
jgi:cytochrome c553